ncbi:MAG: precorrin-3B C(17)-methyltransferase [Candidatus Adiutrix sp.]|jgi:precorrin-3B C17-methyltransferase|nr:precorrin-3B C(17)-methyltransferase [Candidatus Adiutrix sp.]
MRSGGNAGGRDGSPDNKQKKESAGDSGRRAFKLEIIGLGSGGANGVTLAAQKCLKSAEAVYGYGLYMEQALPHLNKKAAVHRSGMTAEVRRAEEAIDSALSGRRTAVVSGGDAGVYGMAGAIFEVAAARGVSLGREPGQLRIKVAAGAPALVAAAALLGAPLTHDFCAISLSDRLTPWELIEKRLDLAAQGDFVIALYNPKSKSREWQLSRAAEILLKRRPADQPVGIVSRAGRPSQGVVITTLGEMAEAQVDMQTLVVIGNQSTFVYQNFMITPRGYIDKYGDRIKKPE